ncbi:hypothetical protein HELRODRAFT_162582 [Helobdella robusta]|uniref:Uncharacterized protein n=1 Tax=Helobdella robusta TaxID=6412 RepID=T1ESV6_HELRO|nr:hypothetical protein HELRODRAFT_162582 [Helobdella robusta]ESN99094.1 hypothetical protein HELRODRAFT_162582 [Helobdella robusta]
MCVFFTFRRKIITLVDRDCDKHPEKQWPLYLACLVATEDMENTRAEVGTMRLASCLKHCISLKQCNIVDYDIGTNPPCWVQTQEGPVRKETLKSHRTNVNYILDRKCLAPTDIPIVPAAWKDMLPSTSSRTLSNIPLFPTFLKCCCRYLRLEHLFTLQYK